MIVVLGASLPLALVILYIFKGLDPFHSHYLVSTTYRLVMTRV